MNLTDNDKREIAQLIQENKPLPDKYRFILFKRSEEIELLWNGKTDETIDTVLPFQTIEHVDEPREEKEINLQGSLFDDSGRQLRGWTNKLIWGNNNLILSSLLRGPIYDEIHKQGGIKLVYIDPPFNVGDDFTTKIKIGDGDFEKKRNILEEIAYRDTWGKGSDSFISMIYMRLKLIHALMSADASIYVHCDYRVSAYLKIVLDEIFGEENFKNEIIWSYRIQGVGKKFWARKHDTIFFYSKSSTYNFKPEKEDVIYDKPFIDTKKIDTDLSKLKPKQKDDIIESIKNNKPLNPRFKEILFDKYYNDVYVRDVWDSDYTKPLISGSKEYLNYPTQKPEGLMRRIINSSSNEGDLIADFFCGSGSFISVAEKMNRKWIGTDLGKFAIHTSRKRLIKTQRQKKEESLNYRAFEILNLGKYQRESFISKTNADLNLDKEQHYINLILEAYNSEKIENPILHGIKNNRYVYVGPINLHVSRVAVETVVEECVKNQITQVDILCFEHEQGLFPNIINEAKEKGVDVSCKIIPPQVFDKKAIDKKQVVFHDVAFIEFKPIVKKNKLSIELTGFSVDYSQEKLDEAMSELSNNRAKVILNNGQIIRISRDKNGIENKEVLTKSWKDWIDYWAVDFDFENKKEIFKRKNEKGEIEDVWTGDYIFENEWQSFKTDKKDIEFKSSMKEFSSKKYTKVAVKVIDIFGNDTMKVLKVNL